MVKICTETQKFGANVYTKKMLNLLGQKISVQNIKIKENKIQIKPSTNWGKLQL